MGAWIAVRGEIGLPSIILSAAVMFWTAGFDILYSLQDVEFDRKNNLFSLPAKFGSDFAILVSRFFHAIMVGLIVAFGLISDLGSIYYIGTAITALFLIYEQSLVRANDISRINTAFFTMNGFVSIGLFFFVVLDLYL